MFPLLIAHPNYTAIIYLSIMQSIHSRTSPQKYPTHDCSYTVYFCHALIFNRIVQRAGAPSMQ